MSSSSFLSAVSVLYRVRNYGGISTSLHAEYGYRTQPPFLLFFTSLSNFVDFDLVVS